MRWYSFSHLLAADCYVSCHLWLRGRCGCAQDFDLLWLQTYKKESVSYTLDL